MSIQIPSKEGFFLAKFLVTNVNICTSMEFMELLRTLGNPAMGKNNIKHAPKVVTSALAIFPISLF